MPWLHYKWTPLRLPWSSTCQRSFICIYIYINTSLNISKPSFLVAYQFSWLYITPTDSAAATSWWAVWIFWEPYCILLCYKEMHRHGRCSFCLIPCCHANWSKTCDKISLADTMPTMRARSSEERKMRRSFESTKRRASVQVPSVDDNSRVNGVFWDTKCTQDIHLYDMVAASMFIFRMFGLISCTHMIHVSYSENT